MTASGGRQDETVDRFHHGRFHLVQPAARGHRAGIDAMLLAALVPDDATGRLADLGAGAGAAGLAVASRVPGVSITLVERDEEMAGFAHRSLLLRENSRFAERVEVLHADVTLRGGMRAEAGLTESAFAHVIMNPPFNAAGDRRSPDGLRAGAHTMPEGLFDAWIRTAGAIAAPAGQLSLIARPVSIAAIVDACVGRFGGLEITPLHARAGENAIRILVTAVRASRARLVMRMPLVLHEGEGHAFSPFIDDLNNGRAAYRRL